MVKMSGEQRVSAPRQKVWEALNDPGVLARCIPGCESLTKEADDRMTAVVEVKIGPIGARFRGTVQLSDLDAPNGCTITGTGNGGIAGSAKGRAQVRLSDDGAGTLVGWTVDAEVGGRMAQLGGPIIEATARQLAGKFFARFGEVVTGAAPVAPAASASPSSSASPVGMPLAVGAASMAAGAGTIWGWVAALVAALLAGYALGRVDAGGGILLLIAVLLLATAAAAFEAGRRRGATAGNGR